MSYFPDIESLYLTTFGSPKKGETEERPVNNYYEGFLNEEDAHLLCGYDDAMEELSESFKCIKEGLDDFGGIENTNFDLSKIDESKINEFLTTEYDPFYDDDEEEIAKLSNETKVVMIIAGYLCQRLSSDRNMIGISLTESMPEEDLEQNKVNYFKNKNLNILERIKRADSEEE